MFRKKNFWCCNSHNYWDVYKCNTLSRKNMAGETSNKSVSVQSSGEPSGDAQVISEETEDIDEIELYAVGEKKILARPNLSSHCYQKLEKDTASQSDMKKTIMIAAHLS